MIAVGTPSLVDYVTHWSIAPAACLAAALLAAGYAAGARRTALTRARRSAMFGGLLVALCALQSGTGYYDDASLTAHMWEHVLLIAAAAPLLVLGAPWRAALALSGRPAQTALAEWRRSRAAAVLLSWWWCSLQFVLVLGVWHIPALFDAAVRNDDLHVLEHICFLLAAVWFWLPALAPELAPRRLPLAARPAYPLLAMPPMAVIAVVLTTAGGPVYALRPPSAETVADQRAAAAVMMLGGGLCAVVVCIALAARWLRIDDRRAAAAERRPRGALGDV